MSAMQMYRLITGSLQKIAEFEQSISDLLEEGYALEGPLVTSPSTEGPQLFQAMVVEEDFLEDEDEEDGDDEQDNE
jgi:hypothetical protein